MDRVWWKQRGRQVWEAFLWALPLITFICMALFIHLVQAVIWVILFGLPIAFLVWVISKGAGVRPSRVLQGICVLMLLRMGIAFGTYLWVHSQEKFVVYTPLEIPASFRDKPISGCGKRGCSVLLASPSVSFVEGEEPASQEYRAPRLKFRGSVNKNRPECVAILNANHDIGTRSTDLRKEECFEYQQIDDFQSKYIIEERQFKKNVLLEIFEVEEITIRSGDQIVAEMNSYKMDAVGTFFGGRSHCGSGSIGFCARVHWWGIMRDESLNFNCEPFHGYYNTLGSNRFIANILKEKHDCTEKMKRNVEWKLDQKRQSDLLQEKYKREQENKK